MFYCSVPLQRCESRDSTSACPLEQSLCVSLSSILNRVAAFRMDWAVFYCIVLLAESGVLRLNQCVPELEQQSNWSSSIST